jgi:hypothetical protein
VTKAGHAGHADGLDPAGMLELDLEPEPDTPLPGSYGPPPFAPPVSPFAPAQPGFAAPVPPFPPAISSLLAPALPAAPPPISPGSAPSPHAGPAARYTFAEPVAAATPTDWRPLAQPRLNKAVRVCATVALLTVAGTYVAAQVDFLRRHQPGVAPETYWIPQLLQIWAPGLAAAGLFAITAMILHRWQQRTARRH